MTRIRYFIFQLTLICFFYNMLITYTTFSPRVNASVNESRGNDAHVMGSNQNEESQVLKATVRFVDVENFERVSSKIGNEGFYTNILHISYILIQFCFFKCSCYVQMKMLQELLLKKFCQRLLLI